MPLDVHDAAGNSAVDLLIVRVLDTTPPTATIARLDAIREGDPVVLDARDSRDNDPSFNETGNSTWTVESGGSARTLFGRTATFAGLAGDYAVTLCTRDAGGNADLATATLRILPRPSLNVAWVVAAVIVVALAFLLVGLGRSRIAPFPGESPFVVFFLGSAVPMGDSLVTMAARQWLLGCGTVIMHPLALAGWVGCTCTRRSSRDCGATCRCCHCTDAAVPAVPCFSCFRTVAFPSAPT